MGHAATTPHCNYAIQPCFRQQTIQQRSLLIGKILRSPSDDLCLVWPPSSKAPPAILLQRHSHGSTRSGTCSSEVSRQQPFLEWNTSLLALPPIAQWWLIYCRRQMDEQFSSFSSNHPAPWGLFFRRGFIRQLSLLPLQQLITSSLRDFPRHPINCSVVIWLRLAKRLYVSRYG